MNSLYYNIENIDVMMRIWTPDVVVITIYGATSDDKLDVFMFSLLFAWTNWWVNSSVTSDLRRHDVNSTHWAAKKCPPFPDDIF